MQKEIKQGDLSGNRIRILSGKGIRQRHRGGFARDEPDIRNGKETGFPLTAVLDEIDRAEKRGIGIPGIG